MARMVRPISEKDLFENPTDYYATYIFETYCDNRMTCAYNATKDFDTCPFWDPDKKCTKDEYDMDDRFQELVQTGHVALEEIELDPVEQEPAFDPVERPEHYCTGSMETIDEMKLIFGIDDAMTFCKLNAWKYRARAPYKGNTEQDMHKADQYLQMYKAMQQEKTV